MLHRIMIYLLFRYYKIDFFADTKIEELGLSDYSLSVLKRHNLDTVEKVVLSYIDRVRYDGVSYGTYNDFFGIVSKEG